MTRIVFPRGEYKEHLKVLRGACAFCRSNDELLIKKYVYWDWIFSMFPYRKYHTLLIPKRHITRFEELRSEELLELPDLLKEIEKRYIENGIVNEESLDGDQMYFCWRSRFIPKEKISVEHFHLHICPKFESQQGIILTDDAWNIDVAILRKQ